MSQYFILNLYDDIVVNFFVLLKFNKAKTKITKNSLIYLYSYEYI